MMLGYPEDENTSKTDCSKKSKFKDKFRFLKKFKTTYNAPEEEELFFMSLFDKRFKREVFQIIGCFCFFIIVGFGFVFTAGSSDLLSIY